MVIPQHTAHTRADTNALSHEHTYMPGCAEVCDKVARIYQKLGLYERASHYFRVIYYL
jgi:hypothetical protein